MYNLYEYYAANGLSPTYANFVSEANLASYENIRENVFERLHLPKGYFKNREILEFGPDTGENALVFARWGALLSLQEPNKEVHSVILDYFKRFDLQSQLISLESNDVSSFNSSKRYDMIVAEGFIYTIKPDSKWIDKFVSCLDKNGIIVVSYLDSFGGFLELFNKLIFNAILRQKIIRNASLNAEQFAYELFGAKWNSINHTRTFHSWFMDVIKNPFVRLSYFIDSIELMKKMSLSGLSFYSSWPSYKSCNYPLWIKATTEPKDVFLNDLKQIEKDRFYHTFGVKLVASAAVEDCVSILAKLISICDSMIDNYTGVECTAAINAVEDLLMYGQNKTNFESKDDHTKYIKILTMIYSILTFLKRNEFEKIVGFCNQDEEFINAWGSPNHYALYQIK